MKMQWILASTAALALVMGSAGSLSAQREGMDLSPNAKFGQTVTPFFEGWYRNPEGTITYSFGYFNRNTEQIIEIPLGPDNFIEPAQYDGVQPTYFAPVNYGGYNGRRERGVFAVTVPEGYDGDVVWTLRMNGETFRVPARKTSIAYELSVQPMAMGSYPPAIWFGNGEKGYGPEGVVADKVLTARVGTPVEVAFFADDIRSDRESGPVPLGVTFWKHQGPGEVTFAQRTSQVPLGQTTGSTTATFSAPGEYMLRIRVDNHRAPDSAQGDQCCWTNGFVRVNVTQ
jgi:hypothetical protein